MLENNNIEQLNNEKVSENEQSSQENSQVNSQQQNSFDEEAIRKLIQSEVDKVRGKYSLELKKKDDELKKLRAEHLTAEEVTKLEIAEQKLAIEEQKKELEEQFQGYLPIYVDKLSLSVACHIGPGALAIACCKKIEV